MAWADELVAVRMLPHALAYAKKGWRVLPVWWPKYPGVCSCRDAERCSSAGKHPIPMIAPDGVHSATSNPEIIRKWWDQYPLANIGIATGKVSGVTVLDIDRRHDGHISMEQLILRHGRPEQTPTAITGGDGRHIYWSWSKQHRCQQDVRAGIDVKSSGGYVLAAPSMHSTGIRYKWHEEGHPGRVSVKAAPPWADLLLSGKQPGRIRKPVNGRSTPLPIGNFDEGVRNTNLFRYACRWQRQALTDEDIANRVYDLNTKCKPPLRDREVERIIRSALKYEKGR